MLAVEVTRRVSPRTLTFKNAFLPSSKKAEKLNHPSHIKVPYSHFVETPQVGVNFFEFHRHTLFEITYWATNSCP